MTRSREAFTKRLAFAGIALGSATFAEQFGLHFGLFGAHYTYDAERMGPTCAGMPVVVPFIWLFLLAATHRFVRFVFAPRSRWAQAALGAVAMTSLDWVMDPIAVSHGLWRWANGHLSSTGIPFENFAAWLIGTFMVHAMVSVLDEPVLVRTAAAAVPVRTLGASYDGVSGTWCHESALLTQFLNAFHIIVAEGERYMIRSMQPALAQTTDPTMRRALVAFIAQEAQHAKAHMQAQKSLGPAVLATGRLGRLCSWVGRGVLPTLFSPRMNLAITSGIEHWTASVGELLLEERWLAHADSQIRDLFEWHSAEEIEHRAVAFDALATFAPGYALRTTGFAIGSFVLLSLSVIGAVDFLLQTHELFAKATLRDLTRSCTSLALRRIALRGARYLAPHFHPTDNDTSALAQATLTRLPTRLLSA